MTLNMSKEQILDRKVQSIVHGIGHNLGMRHDDGGIMINVITEIIYAHDIISGKNEYNLSYTRGEITKFNIKELVNRIPGFEAQGHTYWDDKYEEELDDNGNQISERGTGIITKKN